MSSRRSTTTDKFAEMSRRRGIDLPELESDAATFSRPLSLERFRFLVLSVASVAGLGLFPRIAQEAGLSRLAIVR